jgi:hypothetical protein
MMALRRIHKPRQDSPDSIVTSCRRLTQRNQQDCCRSTRNPSVTPCTFMKPLCDIAHAKLVTVISTKLLLWEEGGGETQKCVKFSTVSPVPV